jgi:hypothetical protein
VEVNRSRKIRTSCLPIAQNASTISRNMADPGNSIPFDGLPAKGACVAGHAGLGSMLSIAPSRAAGALSLREMTRLQMVQRVMDPFFGGD